MALLCGVSLRFSTWATLAATLIYAVSGWLPPRFLGGNYNESFYYLFPLILFFVRQGSLKDLSILRDCTIYYLREDGPDVREQELNPDRDATFFLGDHMGVREEDEKLLEGLGAKVVSVGPRSLHADHCIVLINNELDRREASL